MEHGPKKYWTEPPPGSRLDTYGEGSAKSDVAGPTLKIEVTGDEVRLSEALRGNTVRRVLLALSRFGPRLRKVSVRLAEPANPLGGVDQRCRMRASLVERDAIHSEAINGGFEAAVARAAAQLAKRVDLALDGDGSDGAHAVPAPRRRPALALRRRIRST
jgi:ribosome-associated translation inhibitor RaiA